MEQLQEYLKENNISYTKKNGLISVEGRLCWQGDVDYSQLHSVGWSFYCENASSVELPQLQSVGGYFDCNCKVIMQEKTFNLKVIDGVATCLLSATHYVDGFNVQKMVMAKNYKDGQFNGEKGFIAEKDGVFAHGKTVQQAITDVEFKNIDREAECKKYKSFDQNTKLDITDWYLVYRNITGACSLGAWSFIDSQELKGEYTLREIIEITKGQWNSEQFRQFFQATA